MTSWSVRGKFFAVSVGLVAVVGLASTVVLESTLRGWLEERLDERLTEQVRTVAGLVASDLVSDPDASDALADSVGKAVGSRVTIMTADGRVLGDSEIATDALAAVENHRSRPEVVQALDGKVGMSRRRSATVGADLRYVALAIRKDKGGELSGVARVAYPISEVDATVSRLRQLILVATLFGLLVAVAMSGLASHLISRTLLRLVETTREVASGTPGARVPVHRTDELGALARSVNRMSQEISTTVAALGTERARVKAVLEGMQEGVISIDSERRVELVNGSAREMLDLPSEPAGRSLAELIRVPEIQTLVSMAADDPGRVVEFGFTGNRTLMAHATPQPDSGGLVLVVHDLTRLRRLETMRRDFVANVSHELRTPVSVIRATAETLVDGALDDRAQAESFAVAILRNAERLSRMIDELLDLARIESGAQRLASEPIGLSALVSRVLEALRLPASEREVTLVSEVDLVATVVGDLAGVEQVLTNLIDNAVKYGRCGGQVTVRTRPVGSRLRVEVVDDGPGVAAADRDRLFERFYRVDAGRSRQLGGTGLGLAIVKHLTVAMGGTVGMSPGNPRGSIFWVELSCP